MLLEQCKTAHTFHVNLIDKKIYVRINISYSIEVELSNANTDLAPLFKKALASTSSFPEEQAPKNTKELSICFI